LRAVRRRQHEDEEESAFVSMTDMTVSFLFIVMILLAFFASQLRDPKTVTRKEYDGVVQERNKLQKEVRDLRELLKRLADRPIERYLAAVAKQRQEILKDLQAKLKTDFPDLQVVISDETDALRFKGDGLFKTGSSELRPDKRRIVESIATRLGETLPCYTLGPRSSWNNRCNPAGTIIEAVLVEGHTDSDGQDNNNLTLSTNRANETFFAMTKHEPSLVEFLNDRTQPVLSVAGYGKMRPVADNATLDGKATNRRIDLRIIMYTPRSLEDIRNVQDDLRHGIAGSGAP
jgi:outer membrane protein OmpA-like peptidoglycan-associated protein